MPELPSYYASCYCEENVWRLLQDPRLEGESPHALFLSNARRAFAMWHQRAADPPEGPVVWDYHVVVLARRRAWEVWDLDSRLPFPCPAAHYLRESFPEVPGLDATLRPRFRLVPRDALLARFASDRSHMRTPEGAFKAEPPPLPPIRTTAETMNLWSWVDTAPGFVGEVFDLAGLQRHLALSAGG